MVDTCHLRTIIHINKTIIRGNNGNSNKVENTTITPEEKLQRNERFKDVFHPEVKRRCQLCVPKIDGNELCMRYHLIGWCTVTCCHRATHVPLPPQIRNAWISYLTVCKRIFLELRNMYGNNNNNNNNNGNGNQNNNNGRNGDNEQNNENQGNQGA